MSNTLHHHYQYNMRYNHWTTLICVYATRWIKKGGLYKLVAGNDMIYSVTPIGGDKTTRIDVPNYTMSLYLNKLQPWPTIEEQKVS